MSERRRISGAKFDPSQPNQPGVSQSQSNQYNNEDYFKYAEGQLSDELLPILYSLQNPIKMDDEWYSGIVNFFGGQTNAQKFNLQQDDKFRQGITDLLMLNYQNKYNSPQNQAELERQAGLNPDLLGNISAQPSADPDITQGATDVSSFGGPSSPIEAVSGLMSHIGSIYNFAMDMTSKGVALFDQINSLQDKDFSRGAEALGLVDKIKGYLNGPDGSPVKAIFHPDSNSIQINYPGRGNTESGIDAPIYNIGSPFKSKKNTQRMAYFLNKVFGSNLYKGSYYRDLESLNRDKLSSLAFGKSKYGDSLNEGSTDFGTIMKPLIEFTEKIVNTDYGLKALLGENNFKYEKFRDPGLESEARNAENEYKADYYDELSGADAAGAENMRHGYEAEYYLNADGKEAAEAENESNKQKKEAAAFDRDLKSAFRAFVHGCAERARNGSEIDAWILVGLQGALSSAGQSAGASGLGTLAKGAVKALVK